MDLLDTRIHPHAGARWRDIFVDRWRDIFVDYFSTRLTVGQVHTSGVSKTSPLRARSRSLSHSRDHGTVWPDFAVLFWWPGRSMATTAMARFSALGVNGSSPAKTRPHHRYTGPARTHDGTIPTYYRTISACAMVGLTGGRCYLRSRHTYGVSFS